MGARYKTFPFRNRVKRVKFDRAREMRDEPTPAEAALWEEIRLKKLGWRARRQVTMLGYIADFYFAWNNVVIELDGSAHKGRYEYDRRRDAQLKAAGFKVLRFRNREVFEDMPTVLATIKAALK